MRVNKQQIPAFMTNKNNDFKEKLERVGVSLYILPSISHLFHYFIQDFRFL